MEDKQKEISVMHQMYCDAWIAMEERNAPAVRGQYYHSRLAASAVQHPLNRHSGGSGSVPDAAMFQEY